MNVILFGGAFDPPHRGHQQITHYLLAQKTADEVWYVPAKSHPFAKPMSLAAHRVKMVEMIVDDPRIKVEMYEQEKEGISYSHETLDYLAARYPKHTFSWIVGSDRLPDFHKWVDSKSRTYLEMLKKYCFYVYPRKGSPFEPLYPNMVPLKEAKEWTFSSTEVREKASKGVSIDGLVDPKVAQYIQKHQLYR